ncbi:MAG: leucine--tRNA ligase [Candidatus Krumholzibacteriia bacterium]
MDHYPFAEIEPKWQKRWSEQRLMACDVTDSTAKYYCLMMFPYPSGDLHVGHGRNYIIGDVLARYLRMEGYNVLAPMGWDAFGLPAENAAIRNDIHPAAWTKSNIGRMKEQFRCWGIEYAWEREVASCEPGYYRWTQWLFLQLYKAGLAERKWAEVNWCPSCKTVLANEQVVGGACERCDTPVEDRSLLQWFFRITEYADRLLADLDELEHWPERVKTMQRNWIGRSEGSRVEFRMADTGEPLPCFTTRPDTLWGATYMVLAVEHPMVEKIIARAGKRTAELRDFVARVKRLGGEVRDDTALEKEGIATGEAVINPVNGRRIPLWLANYVVMGYGTGAVMAVPAHDQRDFEFARQYGLPIEEVVQPASGCTPMLPGAAYTEPGIMVNSGPFDGMPSDETIPKVIDYLAEKGWGEHAINYRLRDWLISRQRYWGAPLPIIYCGRCGTLPVSESDLPVELPHVADFRPTGDGRSPLAASDEFLHTTCPKCGGPAERDTDTMDTFVDSSWYFLRYVSPHDESRAFDSERANAWLPVDQYIGGVEHAILHLLYARFITKVLHDRGFIGFTEPFARLFTQGMITKNGAKMSKNRGNVVPPDELIAKYGADTERVYTLFIGPPEKDAEWNDRAVEGAFKFLNRVWRLVTDSLDAVRAFEANPNALRGAELPQAARSLHRKTHQCVQKMRRDLARDLHFNTAISSLMELVNEVMNSLRAAGATAKATAAGQAAGAAAGDTSRNEPSRLVLGEALHHLVLMLSPMAPHLCEELWNRLGHRQSVLEARFPQADPQALEVESVTLAVQVNGKVRTRLEVPVGTDAAEIERQVLELPQVATHLQGRPARKVIVVPNRLVNVVG